MQIFRNLADVQLTKPSVLTIGTFDGLHRGHQDIIRQVKSAAHTFAAQAAVMAFHPRPKAVFAPQRFGNDYLTTPEERIALFEALAIDTLVLIPFTLELAQLTAAEFMTEISERFKLVQLCVGHDFALGKNREGTVARLAELGRELNYTLCEIEPFVLEGRVVSSTEIRADLLTGKIRAASKLLGRYPALTSHVIKGAQRGRTIGFPTANLAVPAERLLPANGVYATFVRFPGHHRRYPSATNVGIRPSFNGKERAVETYILDFNEEIYGQTLTLEFVEWLRPEMKFDGFEPLMRQITQDVERAKAVLTAELAVIAP